MNRMWVLAAFAAGLLVLRMYGCEQQRQGELVERIGILEEQRDSLLHRSHAVDTIYQRDTVRFTRWRTRWDSVVVAHDTLSPELLIADSTVKSCSVALETCEHRVAIRDSLLSTQSSEIRLLKKRKSSRFGCAGPLAATTKGIGLGVACGIRF